MEWLRLIVQNRAEVVNDINDVIRQFMDSVIPQDASGQVSRVARRFALCACAGELATLWGLTGWQAGEAENATTACFTAWLAGFGGFRLGTPRQVSAKLEGNRQRPGRVGGAAQ
jgi:uncharacterized protein (DUF927 family)